MAGDPKTLTPTLLDPDLLDTDAVHAIQRLQERGYEAYLVGGCVRDLLLGQRPKDFDIATSARPQQVKRTFTRNCRIIGRRFKLAHLHFDNNRKILEVSTFRRQPDGLSEDDEDLLITRDNEFGTAMEDALRRDFTVNALFLDPVHDRIIDYTGGLHDVNRNVLRTIGDPVVRFREDPVRIIRAAKFCARLGLDLDATTLDAMREVAPDLVRSAPPRLLEEILRLLRGGHSLESFQLLRDIGAIEVILPVVHDYLTRAPSEERIRFWRTLEALDGRARQRAADPRKPPLDGGLLLGTLFNRPVQFEVASSGKRSATTIAEELITPFAQDLRLPRRDAGCLKRICGVQNRFLATGTKRFKTSSFLRDPYFTEALQLFELSCAAEGRSLETYDRWRAMSERDRATQRVDEGHERDLEATEDGNRRRGRKTAKRSAKKTATNTTRKTARKTANKAAKTTARKSTRNTDRRSARGGAKTEGRRRDRRSEKVDTIEPEALDLSAFDVELDPKRVPTFGAIVEGSRKRRRRVGPNPEDDTYRPPPPPGSSEGPPPPPPAPPRDDDEFGDW